MDIDLLSRIPLFAQLSRDDLSALSNFLSHRAAPAHQTICWIGESGDDFTIVQSGKVEVVQPDESGKEISLGAIGPGGFFGELSLLDGGPRTATVRTTKDSVLLTLGRNDFLNFLERHPLASVHILCELGKRQRDMMQMLRSVKNVNEMMAERTTVGRRFADVFAATMGSWPFIIGQTIVYTLWIVANIVLVEWAKWDPYPFNLMSLVLAAVAGYAAPIIMMSQARQSAQDHIRADLEYQVNVKAHLEVMQLHRKIDRLTELLEGEAGAEKQPSPSPREA
jgi:uncharacterized membrane protein